MTMTPFYMTRLYLDNHTLVRLARQRRLPLAVGDMGYTIHCMLGEVFGDDAPAHFWTQDDPAADRYVTLFSYTDRPLEALKEAALDYTNARLFAGVDWERSGSKRMPDGFEAGTEFGFSTHVVPIVRLCTARGQWRKGAELDAWQAKRLAGAELTRDEVYCDWVARRLENAGARVVSSRLESYASKRLLRRTQKATNATRRKRSELSRSVATVSGVLEVTDPEAFIELVRRGIGRHKGFGFGMLLLRALPLA